MHIQAIDLWKKWKALELMDKSIQGDVLTPVEELEVLRCIRVGLLCTVSKGDVRPTMHRAIKLLEGEESMDLQELDSLLQQEQNGASTSHKEPRDMMDGTLDESLNSTFAYEITMER